MISPAVRDWIERETGRKVVSDSARPCSGGCINESRLADLEEGGLVFLKQNRPDQLPLFDTEKRSLELLRSAGAIRVPEPWCAALVDGEAVFAMEGIRLSNRGDATSQEALGTALARLHDRLSENGEFGAAFDNFIGATPQPNGWLPSWADFYCQQRLLHLFRLAGKKGKRFPDEEALISAVHDHLDGLEIVPSLLHGDLWGGNAGFDEEGSPVLYDPATYFGDREADIAFTRMFGGFGPAFYSAYRERHPEPEPIRHAIYNLYHLLNHFVLFGGGYAGQTEEMMQKILQSI